MTLLALAQHLDDPDILVLKLLNTHAPSLDHLMIRLDVQSMTSQSVVVLVQCSINVFVVSGGHPMQLGEGVLDVSHIPLHHEKLLFQSVRLINQLVPWQNRELKVKLTRVRSFSNISHKISAITEECLIARVEASIGFKDGS
jgi:hypothetical protein